MNAYVCDAAVGAKKTCQLRIGKTILQLPITREQVIKVAESGKTDLLSGFVSKKGRKFSAFLKLDGKKITFEFEPRDPSKKGKPKKTGNTKAKKVLKQVTPKE